MTNQPQQPVDEGLVERKIAQDARTTLAAALDAIGPSWAALADAIEEGRNYENDTVHVRAALSALETVFRGQHEAALSPSPDTPADDDELKCVGPDERWLAGVQWERERAAALSREPTPSDVERVWQSLSQQIISADTPPVKVITREQLVAALAPSADVVEALRALHTAVRDLGEHDAVSKLPYFEESPIKNGECHWRWVQLANAQGKASAALNQTEPKP